MKDTTHKDDGAKLIIQLYPIYPKNGIWVSCEMNVRELNERYKNLIANLGYPTVSTIKEN